MKRIRQPLYAFLPLLSIAAAIAGLVLYSMCDMKVPVSYMADDAIAIMIISVLSTVSFLRFRNNTNSKLYILCSTLNFVSAMRLTMSAVSYIAKRGMPTAGQVVCSCLCILTMIMFTVSLSGAFLLKRKAISVSIHIMTMVHMVLIVAVSPFLYKGCIIFAACLPILIANCIKDYKMNKGEVNDED